MRIFGFLSIFLTKINTNSAKSCLLFRRKAVLAFCVWVVVAKLGFYRRGARPPPPEPDSSVAVQSPAARTSAIKERSSLRRRGPSGAHDFMTP